MRSGSRSGFSLVELLVTASVAMTISYGILTLVGNVSKNTKILEQKLNVLSMEKMLITVMADGAVCNKVLANPSMPKTFQPGVEDSSISLDKIPISAANNAPSFIEKNQSYDSGVFIKEINVVAFKTTGNVNEYYADLQVLFDPSKSVKPMSPLIMPVIVRTQDSGSKKQIVSCATSVMAKIERIFFYFGTGTDTDTKHYCNPNCTWTIPLDAKGAAFVSIAGGGASAIGPLHMNHNEGGNSGGYLMSAPVSIVPGSTISITVGAGGKVLDDSTFLLGSPGKESRFGDLIRCSGGGKPGQCYSQGGNNTSLYNFGHPGIRLGINSGNSCGATGVTMISGSAGEGIYGSQGPGACGTGRYGIGNTPVATYGVMSGDYSGGITPFGYGSGGSDHSSGDVYKSDGTHQPINPLTGDFPPGTTYGTTKWPEDGREGIVIVDYLR